jgi:hypothetical protein
MSLTGGAVGAAAVLIIVLVAAVLLLVMLLLWRNRKKHVPNGGENGVFFSNPAYGGERLLCPEVVGGIPCVYTPTSNW